MAKHSGYRVVGRYLARAVCTLLAGGMLAAGAEAQVVERVSTHSSYAYADASGTGASGTFTKRYGASQLGVTYDTSALPDGSFDFRHELDCAGPCFAGVTTWFTDTITNSGPAATDLRFGSVISAGYISFGGVGGGSYFAFDVFQGSSAVYSAFGAVDASGGTIGTSDGSVFNGLTATRDGLTWGDTPLDLSLGSLGAGESIVLGFRLSTFVNSVGGGRAAVLFGDPHTGGGVSPIPEPATWAMMLLGLGMTGAVLRRRSKQPLPA